MKRKFVFCPGCNYIVSRLKVELAVTDFTCPNCHSHKFSTFYSYGSLTHAKKWEEFKSGNCSLQAPYRPPRPYIDTENNEKI